MSKTPQRERFERLVKDATTGLIGDGVRVISLPALFDRVQHQGQRRGWFAPSWAALVDTLEGMDDYDVSGFEDYTVTLPKAGGPPCRANLTQVAYRIIDGIAVYHGDGGAVQTDADILIGWIRRQLVDSTPEREE